MDLVVLAWERVVVKIWTVGHGTVSGDEFVDLLGGAGVEAVADVRRHPGSRRNPQYSQEAMTGWLGEAGIGYRWFEGLGGRRRVEAGSRNLGLVNDQFRAYADHMGTVEFGGALDALVATAAERPTAVMCSESVWWRCHRRLLADHLVLVEGVEVVHLFHDGRVTAHPVMSGARREGDGLVYEAPAQEADP